MAFQKLIPHELQRDHERTRGQATHRGAALDHARHRALERYGIDLSPAEVAAHEESIRTGETVHLGNARTFDGSTSKEFHALPGGDRPWLAVYDLRIGCIVTYLGSADQWMGHLTQDGVDLVLDPGLLDGLAYAPAESAS